jgi:hypothetical protein
LLTSAARLLAFGSSGIVGWSSDLKGGEGDGG